MNNEILFINREVVDRVDRVVRAQLMPKLDTARGAFYAGHHDLKEARIINKDVADRVDAKVATELQPSFDNAKATFQAENRAITNK